MSAKHQANMSRERKSALAVLIAASVVAVACAFGPIWIVRLGLVLAVLGAVGSVWFAFRELARMDVVHRTELKAERLARTTADRAHHAESMELINTFKTRYLAHATQVDDLRGTMAGLQQELSTVRGNLVSARAEAIAKAQTIADLQASLAEREAVLVELQQRLEHAEALAADESEVVTLPSRGIARKTLAEKLPTAAELWTNGEHPTSVDFDALDVALLASGRVAGGRAARREAI
ncbi:hypothetical protein ACSDQ9_04870 [Aestuariimicrobium soli]|uniref:hypothetical protein n=1 Tax=Aestuariimicrobium soli TaxID=2035834 RepID=UPI003EBD6550